VFMARKSSRIRHSDAARNRPETALRAESVLDLHKPGDILLPREPNSLPSTRQTQGGHRGGLFRASCLVNRG
jgi:hypothetical protein